MTIPTEVIMRMATLGLNEAQARAVADMLTAVEAATKADVLARMQPLREKARERYARYHQRLGISTREWRDLRDLVFQRDGLSCHYCGASEETMHVDHVLPLIRGGSNDIDNLVVACRACNCGKSGRSPEEWLGQ